MSMKKPAVLLAFVGACALAFTGPASVASPLRVGPVPAEDAPASSLPVGDLDTALTSKDGQAPEVAEVVDRDPARLVGVIVQLEEGIDRSAALASVNEAVAASFPGVQVRVEREYANVLDGFALSAPAGSLEEIRGVAGVKAAFLEREGHVSDAAAVDAEGGTRASQIEGQDPANLSAQLMMRTDQVTQKGEGKVVAIIDTGVDMTHQAFTPALTATPALSEDRVDELKAQLGEGKTGVYVNEKFPFAYDYADGDNDASPREGGSGFHGTHVAGIAAGNADKIVGTAPDAQIIVGKVTRSEDDVLLDSALLAALDDMLVLHPDVINLSLGWTAGMDNEADSVYATVYKKLQEAGITVNAAAGNAFSTGYGNMSGKGLPYASDPDSSVIDEPATYSSVVAVASVENALIRNAFTAAGKDIGYQRSRGMNGEKVAYFSDLPVGTYEYVDAGFASEEDVAALKDKYLDGLAGKIALVSRGNMTYQKKVENLYDLPDGEYTLTIEASNDGPSSAEQSISYKFRLDATAPVISNLTYGGEGPDMVISFDVTDASPLAGVDLHDPADGLWFYRHIFTPSEGSVGEDGICSYHVELPIMTIMQAWENQGGTGGVVAHPYVLAWDYGLNPSDPVTLDLPTNNNPDVRLPCADPAGGSWVKDSVGWWYRCADGMTYLKAGWFTINGSEYQFGPSGYMMTGFLKRVSGEWVYADPEGALVGGWVRDGVYGGPYWYYLDPATKVMRTGWLFERGSWYYLGASGNMHTGWITYGSSWYYLDSTGAMRTGWFNQGGTWYYLGSDGVMLTGVQKINERTYTFDPSGALVG